MSIVGIYKDRDWYYRWLRNKPPLILRDDENNFNLAFKTEESTGEASSFAEPYYLHGGLSPLENDDIEKVETEEEHHIGFRADLTSLDVFAVIKWNFGSA